MKMILRVEYNDGKTQDVTCSAKDFVAFEDKFQRSVARFEQELRLTDLLWLSWHSLHRQSIIAKDFDSWLDNVDGVNASDQDPKSEA